MPVAKRSFSLDPEVSDALDRAVGRDSRRASAFVNQAVKRQLRLAEGLRAVQAWEAEHGSLTPDQLAEADRLLDAVGLPRP